MIGLVMLAAAAATPSHLGKADVLAIRHICKAPHAMLAYRPDGSVRMRVPPHTDDRTVECVLAEIEKRVPVKGYIVP